MALAFLQVCCNGLIPARLLVDALRHGVDAGLLNIGFVLEAFVILMFVLGSSYVHLMYNSLCALEYDPHAIIVSCSYVLRSARGW